MDFPAVMVCVTGVRALKSTVTSIDGAEERLPEDTSAEHLTALPLEYV